LSKELLFLQLNHPIVLVSLKPSLLILLYLDQLILFDYFLRILHFLPAFLDLFFPFLVEVRLELIKVL
jgi:hypothetical protein